MTVVWILIALAAITTVAAGAYFYRRRLFGSRPVTVTYEGAVRAIVEGRHPGLFKLLVRAPGIPTREKALTGSEVTIRPRGADVTRVLASREEDAALLSLEEQLEAPQQQPVEMPAAEGETSVLENVFREYDIRGLAEEELPDDAVKRIGRALGMRILREGRKEILIGRDARSSGSRIAKALTKGLLSVGVNVCNLGTIPTPVLYFATKQREVPDGAMITASHNGAEYNGMKLVLDNAPIWGENLKQLYRETVAGKFMPGAGSLRRANAHAPYMERVLQDFETAKRGLKVVVDGANGMAGAYAPFLLRKLGHQVSELDCSPDGNFPGHAPDPTVPANLETLIGKVREEQADLGLAFDGDADRLVAVDGQGEIVWPDRLLLLFVREVLEENPGATVIYDVKCSVQVQRMIEELGGRPLMWMSGHSRIRSKMQETGALLAGEQSGHFFFNDRWFGFDDAIYAACRLLNGLTRASRTFEETLAALPRICATPEYRIEVGDDKSREVVSQLHERIPGQATHVIDLDGLRVEYGDGWGLIRASNTSPCLVLRFEGDNERVLQRIQDDFRARLNEIDPDLALPF